jgi:hypothetical protein
VGPHINPVMIAFVERGMKYIAVVFKFTICKHSCVSLRLSKIISSIPVTQPLAKYCFYPRTDFGLEK